MVNLGGRTIPRIQGTSGLDTPVSVSGATAVGRGGTHPPRTVGHAIHSIRERVRNDDDHRGFPEVQNRTHTSATHNQQRLTPATGAPSASDVVIISFASSTPVRAATRTSRRAPEPPPRSPGITTLRDTPAVRRTTRGADGGGDCRAGCRMDPGGRTGPLGTPRRPGHAQTQGSRRRAHLEHVAHPASPSDEPRPVAHAPGPRDGLSKATVSTLVAERCSRGLLIEEEARTCRATSADRARACARLHAQRPASAWRSSRASLLLSVTDLTGEVVARRCELVDDAGHRPEHDDRARRGHAVPGPGAADAAGDDGSGNRPGSDRDHRLHRQHRALLLHAGVARRRRGGPGPRRSRPPPGPGKERPHHHAGERRQARRTGHLRALRAGRGAQPALPVGR